MVVASDASIREVLQLLLAGWEMRVELAANAPTAQASIRASAVSGRPFRLLIVDAAMPGSDDFQQVEGLDQEPKSATPVLFLHGVDEPRGEDARGEGPGSEGLYLPKPVSPAALSAAILRVLGVGDPTPADSASETGGNPPRAAAPAASPEAILLSPEDLDDVLDLQLGIERCFGDYSMFRKLVALFFDEVDQLVDEMYAACRAGDASQLARTAHRLKGTVVYLGARPASEATSRVEQMGIVGELDNGGPAIEQLRRELDRLRVALRGHHEAAAVS